MRIALILFVCLLTSQTDLLGQISIAANAEEEVEVCKSSSSMIVLVDNPTGNGVILDSVKISFPDGIEYVLGSVSTIYGSTVTEVNVNDVSQIVLSGASISSQDSLKFQVNYEAKMPAIDYQDLGNIFRNTVTVIYNSTASQETEQSNSYNILYPVFSITNVTPTTQTFTSGLSTTRDITIVNAGYGATDQLYITDVRTSATLQLNATSLGVISGDTIILSGSDFNGIGNGDDIFDSNESIVVTETLTGTSCTDITITSAIEVHWGCDGVLKESSTSYANTTIDFQSPNIDLSSTSELASCFENDVLSEQTLTLENTSSGVANEVVVDIYKSSGSSYDQTIFSRFDESSVYYTVGPSGSPIYPTLTTTGTSNSGLYSVLGSNPIGRFEFTIPSISPGTSIIVHWNTYSKISGTCQDEKYMGWKAGVTYEDVCAGGGYSESEVGQGTNGQLMTVFTETPNEIQNGVSQEYSFLISSFENSLPSDLGVSGKYKCTFTIDAGLQYQSLVFRQNNVEWSASSLSAVGGTVVAYFDDPAPFTVPKSELVLTVLGVCGSSGYKNIELDVSYMPDLTCSPDFLIPLVCDEVITTRLHCPLADCDGFRFLSFDANRVNFGQSDNDLDGDPDGVSSLDFSRVKRNRIMVGDTMETVYSIVVDTSTANPNFANFYVEADIELGTNLSFIEGTVNVYDTYSSSSTLCTTVQLDIVDSGNDRKFRYSFVPDTHCPSLPNSGGGFVFKHGDSITFTAKYRLSGNIGSMVEEVKIDNDMFSSSFLDPWGADASSLSSDKWSCDDYDGNVTLIGFFWINQSANNVTVNNCSKYIAQNFGLSIGDCCSNYGGGNLFPYEYRHWGILKEVKMVKPSNYTALNTKIQLYNTKKTNATNYKLLNISPDAVSGDTLYYNIEQYYTALTLSESDDGFNGRFKVELAPDCNTPQNNYENVQWFFNYQESSAIDGSETDYMSSAAPDKIRYSPAVIEIVANDPIQDANQRDVSWTIGLKNTNNSSTANTWLHLDVPTNLTITSVETTSGTPLSISGDLYMVDDIGSNATENIVINGRISNCDTVLFTAYSGFDCIAFPTSFSAVNCSYDTQELYVESKRSNYQTRIKALQSGTICGQYVNLEIDISSVEIAHMYDMEIKLNVQDTLKMLVMPDSSSFLYPYSGSYSSVATPTFNGVGYNYIINDFVSSFAEDGIPGVMDLSNNRYKLKVTIKLNDNFTAGDNIHVQIDGKNACAEDLKTINLTFDPSSKFTKNEISGLHLDVSNSWSASWGDYDNDGYDDLFVPNYNVNEGNLLYHNQGDGTFTKITSGPVVSTIGSAVSGTWADFDNDSDLDLFVSYNSNGADQLFVNNGNGTFSSTSSDPIISSGLYTHGAAWGDYDNDGYLDIVLSDYHLTNSNSLIRNKGDGTFERVDNSPISLETSSSVGVNWADFDGDGDLDVFIANTEGQDNLLYENVAGEFEKILSGPVVSDGGTSVGGTWGDYDNDGDLDLYVSNSSDQDPNFLYDNNGDGTFTKNTTSALVLDSTNSHGATWCDYDNDGDLDMLVANNLSQNFLFANDGSGNFTKLSNAITNEFNDSYGASWSDYDTDGDYDLIVINQGANVNDFFTNDKGNCNNYLAVRLNGCHTNTFGIGAKVKVKATINGVSVWQTREVSSQNNGLGGQNSLKTIFGVRKATIVDSIVIQWPSGVRQVLTNHAVNQEITFVEECGSKVCGYVYYDENMNGVKDTNELGLSNQLVKIEPYNNFVFTTNGEGYFQTYIADGTYDLSYVVNSEWSEVDDTIYTITVNMSDGVDYCGNDFGITPSCTNADLKVQMSAGAFRRGLRNELNVVVSNEGVAKSESTILTVTVSESVSIINQASSVSNIGGENIYTFDIGDLPAFEDTLIALIDSVSITSNLGDLVDLTVSVSSSSPDCQSSNDQIYLQDVVVGSIDPNEKYVLNDGGNPFEGFFKLGETVFYKIAFQNVGTYPAQRVVIIDTLSASLDASTIKVLNTSHPMNFVREGHVLKWYNEDIQLMDSTTNEEESHGFVMFQINAVGDLDPYTQIDNNAHIQFDYNHFIVTNNTEAIALPVHYREESELIVFPNPADEDVQVLLIDSDTKRRKLIAELRLYSPNGKLVYKAPIGSDEAVISEELKEGEYVIVVEDQEGNLVSANLVKL